MTIHKLKPEEQAHSTPDSPLLDVSLGLNHVSHFFTDTVVRARAARALSGVPTRFPICRIVRCAVRSKIEPLFDDVAMHCGLDAHRLEDDYVLLDGGGVFVSAWGAWKGTYSSFTAAVWADSPARA